MRHPLLARGWLWVGGAALLCAAGGIGCSTVTVPVLRHETGEVLGSGKFRVGARYESGRMFPLMVPSQAPYGVPQPIAVFQGGVFGINGAVGLYRRAELQADSFYQVGGGGWRIGTKFQLLGRNLDAADSGNFAVAASVGYGRYSAKGTVSYGIATGFADVTQALAADRIDFGFPVSYRFSKQIAVHSGLTFFNTNVRGSSDANYVEDTAFDVAVHLGWKVTISRFEGDIEFAEMRVHDPFVATPRFIPFWGIAGGFLF